MIRNKDQKSGCTGRYWATRDISFGNQYEGYILHHFLKLNYLLSKYFGFSQWSSSEGILYCTSSIYYDMTTFHVSFNA
jgi:hypothetical protein